MCFKIFIKTNLPINVTDEGNWHQTETEMIIIVDWNSLMIHDVMIIN